jgi:carboxypeptidase C (cathepsin A)
MSAIKSYSYDFYWQDYILNYKGVEAMIDSLETRFADLYRMQDFTDFTVNGQPAGMYKTAGTFSYVRFYGAGHEVPAYEWTDVERGAVRSSVSPTSETTF